MGRSLEALYKLRHRPGAEGFAAAWDEALTRGARRLEDMAFERALVGTRTPIVSGGQLVDWWDKPDNALLRFLLRHRLPQTYGAQLSEAEAHRRFVQQLGPGHPVYESIRADVLAAEAARAREAAQAHAAALQARRAEIGQLEGFDPDEMEDEPGDAGDVEEVEDIMALDDDAFLAAWERQRAETRRRLVEEYGGQK